MQRAVHKRRLYPSDRVPEDMILPKEKPRVEQQQDYCPFSNKVDQRDYDVLIDKYFEYKSLMEDIRSKLINVGIDPERKRY